MHGLQSSFLLAMALTFSAVAEAQTREPAPRPLQPIASTVELHDTAPIRLTTGAAHGVEVARVHVPGASYVKLHFGRFELPDGVTVVVADEDGREVYRYANGSFDAHTLDRARGDDGRTRFFAMSVTGDTAVVRLTGDLYRFDPARHGVVVDLWTSGSDLSATASATKGSKDDPVSQLETTCRVNERYDAKCYAESHPAVYDRSIPVAKVITAYGEVCTAWRVGPDNHMLTVQHCLSGQDDLDGAEIWFQYRATSCGSPSTLDPVKVTGGELLTTDGTLDYALFTVDNFENIAYLGHLGLDVRNAGLGEGIFIPQHGLGKPKQIALESDMNHSGLCEVDDTDHYGYAKDSDIGYYCDTTTSSSGSPVVSRVTGDVIALHHLGGCFNSASKMSLIWPQIKSYFGGVVPHGDGAVPWDEREEEPKEDNLLPEAHFGYHCEGLECSFDASGSEDADGSIESYGWNFGDGATATGVAPDHVFDAEGSYTVTLTVEDDQGGSDGYSKTVTVTLPNQEPTAKLSAHCVENACAFSGAGSTDSDGEIVSWSWKFGDGASATGSEVSHDYAAAGTYTVTLTVKDDAGASDTRSFTTSVQMPNQPPVADFIVSCDDLDCAMDGAASNDPDGSIVAWSWDYGDRASGSGAASRHVFAEAGSYTIVLTVEDNDGATATTSRSVSVQAPEPESEPPNNVPQADFSWSCDLQRCVFDAGASQDDGEIVGWRWNFGDGREATGERVTHEYETGGRFKVSLTVEDDQGATDGDWAYVDVELPDQTPVAQFSVNCSERNCTLDAGSSTHSAGGIARYDWDFGDGSTAEGRTVTHEYTSDGVYRVTLKVTDGDTLSDTRTRTVRIESERAIELKGTGGPQKSRGVALLRWAYAETDTVQILRNGKQIAETANTGKYLDTGAARLGKSARYQVCDASGGHCSDEILVMLGSSWGGKLPAGNAFPGKFKQ